MLAADSDNHTFEINLIPVLKIALLIVCVFFLGIAGLKCSGPSDVDIKSGELERLATLVIEESSWETDNIRRFIEKWSELDDETIKLIADKGWYQHFQFLLREMVSVQQDSEPESDIKSYKRSRYNETLIQLANLTKNSDPLLTISGIDLDSASSLRKADAKDAVTSALPAVKVNTNLENSAELESQNSNYKSEVDNLFTKLRETLVVDKVDDATQLFIDNPSKDPFAALMSGIDKFSAKKRDEVLIANFKNTDSGTNPSEVTKNKLKKSNSNEESFDATTLDLNHVVKKFVNAYVAGDLKQFDTLFDEQAKTNDQKDLAGIKHDYLDLFSTTSSRNMVITDIHWILSEKQAIGLGDFTATVADSAGRTKRSENGKVQIIARKVDSELKITHFYHTVGDN